MKSSEHRKIYDKAISLGFDPFNDPVGKYLANDCTILCALFELFCALCFLVEGNSFYVIGIAGIIFMALYFIQIVKIAGYSQTGFFSILLISLFTSPFSFPFAIAIRLGFLRK